MLIYARNKSVGVQKTDDDFRTVSGILEDELYAMQCEIRVYWPTLEIRHVQTRMKRFTTQRCPLASEVFNRAEGWKINPDLDSRIKKELGREGCRHMAALMVDCCQGLVRAEFLRAFQEALLENPNMDRQEFLATFFAGNPGLYGYLRLI